MIQIIIFAAILLLLSKYWHIILLLIFIILMRKYLLSKGSLHKPPTPKAKVLEEPTASQVAKKPSMTSHSSTQQKQNKNSYSWTCLDLMRGGTPKPPVFTAEMISPNNNPVSTRTEAKKIYRNILERYRVVSSTEISNYVDRLSQDIESASLEEQYNVNMRREDARELKKEIEGTRRYLNSDNNGDFHSVSLEIESLEKELLEAAKELTEAIEERDDFKQDKREYIARYINSIIHKDGPPFNTKYFIYKDARGVISARIVDNCGITLKYIYGICRKKKQNRTFRKDRILEYTSNSSELIIAKRKYQSKQSSFLP